MTASITTTIPLESIPSIINSTTFTFTITISIINIDNVIVIIDITLSFLLSLSFSSPSTWYSRFARCLHLATTARIPFFFIILIIVFLATSPFILPPPSSDSYGSARRSNEPINMRYPSNVTSLGRIEGGEVFDSSFFCSYCSMVIAPLSQVKPLFNLLIRNNNTFTRISHYCSKFIYSQISLLHLLLII